LRRVGLYVKKDPLAAEKADEFTGWLAQRRVAVIRAESSGPQAAGSRPAPEPPPDDLLCVFVLGGDGTFLSAVRWIGNRPTPLLGVKFGEIGFLAEVAAENLFPAAESLLKGELRVARRMRLEVEVVRADLAPSRETVLNDVVINRGTLARLANIITHINGHYLTTFRADGLVVATPTGSTAYSLAAGGPVIHPKVPGIILTPICPFTLTNRPLIVPDDVEITIRLESGSSDIALTFDGQKGLELVDSDAITIRKSAYPVHMIMPPDRHYFDVLKGKLRWSGGRV
jgi:NAD+ kinase